MIKAVVADDSGLMRLIISDILNADTDIKVIATAKDGKEAVEKTSAHKPDILVLDMTMGEYDGMYAIENIMKECPTPILILSALGNSNHQAIMDALSLGAVDYINKPEYNKAKVREIETQIVEKVKLVAKQANKGIHIKTKVSDTNNHQHTFGPQLNYDSIVVGSSTGGPTALEILITNFPENLPVPVIVAQHMPSNFVPSFVERLNKLTPLHVLLARKDDDVLPGKIYIAPGSRNIKLKKSLSGRIQFDYDHKKYKEFNHPSVNALMLSASQVYGNKTIGVILTGMGKDGSEGMRAIKEVGGYTVVQDKKTSVVYGMPRAVKEAGDANQSVSIHEMSGFLISCLA